MTLSERLDVSRPNIVYYKDFQSRRDLGFIYDVLAVVPSNLGSIEYIREKIKSHYPNDNVVVAGSDKNQSELRNKRTWVCDAVNKDSSARRYEEGVVVACQNGQRVMCGGIVLPHEESMLLVCRAGLFMNGEKVSEVPLGIAMLGAENLLVRRVVLSVAQLVSSK